MTILTHSVIGLSLIVGGLGLLVVSWSLRSAPTKALSQQLRGTESPRQQPQGAEMQPLPQTAAERGARSTC